jgi:hypothetical protein
MSAANDPPPYRLTLVGNVREDIKRLAMEADLLGKKQAFLSALLAAEKRLERDPAEFGELRYSLANGVLQCHIGALRPVAVQFAIHEERRDVLVLKIQLLGS